MIAPLLQQCANFINEYAPAILEILSQELNPQLVCTTLKLCTADISKPGMSNVVHFYTKFFTPATHHYNTRNSYTNNFDVITTHRHTYFRSSFFLRSVNMWSNLPSALKNCSSLRSLKTALSNHYLSKLPSNQPP